MATFTLNDVTLDIPDALVTGQIAQAMSSNRYEHTEAEALRLHLRPRDRFLDLGAGAGYLVALAARAGVAAANGVEANPGMVAVATANLKHNGGTGEIAWGAIVDRAPPGGSVTFTLRRSFWASSLTPPDGAASTGTVAVPALPLADALARFDPTLACIDIEGGEVALIDAALPPALRLLVVEIHPPVYGKAGIKRLFDALSAKGFCYVPTGSRGGTVVFERVAPPR